jgi:hypothetical protein
VSETNIAPLRWPLGLFHLILSSFPLPRKLKLTMGICETSMPHSLRSRFCAFRGMRGRAKACVCSQRILSSPHEAPSTPVQARALLVEEDDGAVRGEHAVRLS